MPNDRFNDQEQIGLRLGQIARRWRNEIDRQLTPYGLTEARWLTLLHLSRLEQPVQQKDLARAVNVQGSTLVRTLDWLESEQLIKRRSMPANRRSKSVHLTARAEPILEQIQKIANGVRAEIFSDVDSADIAICLRVFEQMTDRLHGMGMEPRRHEEHV